MIRRGRKWVLFIEPKGLPAEAPVVDELTRRMTAALRQSSLPQWVTCGFHTCVCDAASDSSDRVLPNGAKTNTLCVHYLEYHRDEVPPKELKKVRSLDCGLEEPSSNDLHRSVRRGPG